MDLLDELAIEIAATYRANRDNKRVVEFIDLQVKAFSFKCNPVSGVVQHIPMQSGGVMVMLSQEIIDSYKYFVQQALSLAAKIDLIERLSKLNDPAVNAIIPKAGVHSPQSVQQVLNQLVGKMGWQPTFLNRKPPTLSENHPVRMALSKVGPSMIINFQKSEEAWSYINTKSPQHQPPTPSQSRRT